LAVGVGLKRGVSVVFCCDESASVEPSLFHVQGENGSWGKDGRARSERGVAEAGERREMLTM
jgi:hypothetical protein